MKRFLLLFCTAVLVCSLMIVPAFASESYQIEFIDCNINSLADFVLPHSTYVATIYDASNTVRFTSEPFDFDGKTSYYSLMDGDVLAYKLWIDLLPDDGVTVFEVEHVNEDYFNVWSEDMCVVFSLTLDSPSIAPDPDPVSPIAGIFDVFGGVGSWIAGQLGTTTSLFWNGQSLTFLGVLSVCALGLAVILLLVMVIVRFLRFRG